MKKVIYLLIIMITGVFFTSCDPLEDIEAELAAVENPIVGVEEYTFTADDYAAYSTELNGEEYFETQDVADQIIPDLLPQLFPVWGEGSLLNVTYNLLDVTVSESINASSTLSSLNDIDGYLASNFETTPDGNFVELTRDANVLTYTLSDNDFDAIANAFSSKYPDAASSAGRFGNFERRSDRSSYWSDAMVLEALYEILGEEYNVGQVVAITFAIFDGSSGSETFFVQNNSYAFLNLGIDAGSASPPSTAYELSGQDYDDIATALATTYPGPASNVGRFGSFDRRSSSSNYWSDDMLLEAFNIILPAASEGDLYDVTYAVFTGSVGTETMTLVYEGGTYVPSPFIVEVTSVVAKNNGDWEFPYVFTRADYDSFGFRFPNFSSSNIYILDIFLEDLLPFAQAGDVATVQYEFFNGSTNTKFGVSVFDGNKWLLTPDVIETTFQYGFEDGEWVPDNTIPYTLLAADYANIAAQFATVQDFENAASSMANFGNYDRRVGNSAYWSNDMIVESFNFLLSSIDPNAAEGQKYAMTFAIFDGSNGFETISVIKQGGVWVEK